MAVTWRDSITTLAAAGAVALERAQTYGWGWALTVRWTIVALVVLGAIVFLLNAVSERVISWLEYALALAAIVLAVFGLSYATAGYVTWLMFAVVAMWAVSLVTHVAEWIAEPAH